MKTTKRSKTDYYSYEVIVIGAGHAGCEAALASARNGARTMLITISLDSIAAMPCNSAIGGPGRGQLVREIDVLGGEMAKNVDRTYIHSRMLNTSRGPALRTSRAIVDKRLYFLSMKKVIENQIDLDLKQGLVVKIDPGDNGYRVIMSDETDYDCRSIVISAGTFLRGRIFWGDYELEAGRQGEINSRRLAKSLESLGYCFGRLRTETPPRVDKKTVDFSETSVQTHDEYPRMFSYDNVFDGREQVDSFSTAVDRDCIEYIIRNIKRSSVIKKGLGSCNPRYCPSIEDKVMRFYHKEHHPVFIQPEGKNTNEMYLHGLFTTFSEEIQEGIVKRIRGLNNAVITRPGYGVEYDYLKPFQLKTSLESKKHKNMFFAGQVNGTTGYEEAAAQGVIAGLNAASGAKGKDSLIISRQDGYIGVMIDDIVIRGVTEPYRMLTSRNEFRLLHRHDNADKRMAKFLDIAGMKQKRERIAEKYLNIDMALKGIKDSSFYNEKFIEDIKQDRLETSSIKRLKKDFSLSDTELEGLIIDLKYEIYLGREMERLKNIDSGHDISIPDGIDYRKVKNISSEAIYRLNRHRPETVSQAARLEGVRPLDILSLEAYIKSVSRETYKA